MLNSSSDKKKLIDDFESGVLQQQQQHEQEQDADNYRIVVTNAQDPKTFKQKKQNKKESKMNEQKSMMSKYTHIFLVVALYWFISITMVFVNKGLLSGTKHFDAPFFVTWFQCVVTVLGLYLIELGSTYFPNLINFPKLSPTLSMCKQILPLSLVFVGMIAFNNLCLKYVGVSFYYVGRCLTTVFNVMFTYIILQKNTSFRAIMCCGIIIFGFYLGVDQEGDLGTLSVAGVIFGVLASLFVSLYSIYTKKALAILDENIWLLAFYNNVNACFLFLPLIPFNNEMDSITNSEAVFTIVFWVQMMAGGIFGLAIGFVTGLQIQVTSPLTHNISGTAKAAAQTVMATQFNDESKSVLWWLSNILVLGGSLGYARVKQQEMAKKESLTSTSISK